MQQPASSPAFRILIAEDSRTQAERLRYLLEGAGHRVWSVSNGRDALAEAARLQPDLVLSDVNMPEMDGFELSRRLHADPALQQLRVILVTSMSEPEDVIRGLQCGADGFVLKPYEAAYLLDHVQQVMANSPAPASPAAGAGIDIHFDGREHVITAGRRQILNLLLSTYKAAIERNKELTRSKESLSARSAELARANRFLDSVIEHIPHAVFVKNADDLRYVRVNRAVEAVMGRPRGEIVGKVDEELLAPEIAAHRHDEDRQVLQTRSGHTFEQPIPGMAGGDRVFHTQKLVLVDERNRPEFLLGIAEDVTEKKERDDEILRLNARLERRTAEADAANRAKGTFLATMSHEIRTPMNGMLGLLELLSLSSLDAQQRETLELIRDSSNSLLRIVDDILSFSKLEAGQLDIRPEPASLAQVVHDVERMYGPAAAGKGLALTSRIDSAIAPVLRFDPLRLRQILGNFVSNSLKFTSRGFIEIMAEAAPSGADMQEIRVQVRDTGIGISRENQARLFQPFSQGDAEAARLAGGTGLGLTICRRLAEMMGGSVEMDSELGQGTTMTLRLALPVISSALAPAASSGAAHAQPALAGPPHAQGADAPCRVLVVDDHPTNRLLLVRQVQALGYDGDAVADGQQALAQWASGAYSIILSDCEMPGISGYELARRIRSTEQARGGPRIPVIACTAHALADEHDKCLAAGMDDCMVKPIGLQALQRKLAQWLPRPPSIEADADAGANGDGGADVSPIDLQAVAATWGGGASGAREVLDSFLGSSQQDLLTLKTALAARDAGQLASTAHHMRGASAVIGAAALAQVCEEVELAAQAQDWASLDFIMRELGEEFERLHGWRQAAKTFASDGAAAEPSQRPS